MRAARRHRFRCCSSTLTGYAAVQASLAGLRAAEAESFPQIFLAANGTRLSGSLNITSIPGTDQQLPIVNLPGNQLGISGTQFSSTALVGATVPLYDGGSRAVLLEQARTKVDEADTQCSGFTNDVRCGFLRRIAMDSVRSPISQRRSINGRNMASFAGLRMRRGDYTKMYSP